MSFLIHSDMFVRKNASVRKQDDIGYPVDIDISHVHPGDMLLCISHPLLNGHKWHSVKDVIHGYSTDGRLYIKVYFDNDHHFVYDVPKEEKQSMSDTDKCKPACQPVTREQCYREIVELANLTYGEMFEWEKENRTLDAFMATFLYRVFDKLTDPK